jgi:hypothetical protein
VHLCHTDDPARPDCYRRVTVYAEPVGVLLGLKPEPSGIAGIIGRDGSTVSPEESAIASLVALTEELSLYDDGPDGG